MPVKLHPWRGRSRRSRIVLVTALLGLMLGVIVAATTSFESYKGTDVRPRWAEPCRNDTPRHDRTLLADCARATGFVAWVRTEGAGPSRDVHFALVGRFGVIIVKLGDPNELRVPHISSHVTVVGPLVRARNGMREIQAWHVSR